MRWDLAYEDIHKARAGQNVHAGAAVYDSTVFWTPPRRIAHLKHTMQATMLSTAYMLCLCLCHAALVTYK